MFKSFRLSFKSWQLLIKNYPFQLFFSMNTAKLNCSGISSRFSSMLIGNFVCLAFIPNASLIGGYSRLTLIKLLACPILNSFDCLVWLKNSILVSTIRIMNVQKWGIQILTWSLVFQITQFVCDTWTISRYWFNIMKQVYKHYGRCSPYRHQPCWKQTL